MSLPQEHKDAIRGGSESALCTRLCHVELGRALFTLYSVLRGILLEKFPNASKAALCLQNHGCAVHRTLTVRLGLLL